MLIMNHPVVVSERIKELISAHLSDSLPLDELSELKAWIDESPAHRKHFNEIRAVWALSGKSTLNERDKTKKLLDLVTKVSRHSHQPRRNFWTWQRIAASWIVIFISAGIWGWKTNENYHAQTVATSVAPAETVIQAKMGSQSMILMPDGSRVWLNGGSKLTYSSMYGEKDREVHLSGEGCFEVVTHPEKPFVVNASGLAIKAYGTVFNVKAYPEDKAVTTTLVKGKVTITGKDENNQLFSHEMKSNENVTYLTERVATVKEEKSQPATERATTALHIPEPVIIENNIKTELYTSWKDDSWVIEKQKLGVLSKDFERRYDVRIQFVSDEVMNYHFTGTIQRETIEQVMTILRRTIPLKYSFDKNVIIIDIDKRLEKEFNMKNI
jgi:ferric-dicitrate binding protein FerR (iron transport regulator)